MTEISRSKLTKDFENQRHAAHGREDAAGFVGAGVAEDALPLAVIAHAPGLEQAEAVEVAQGGVKVVVSFDGAKIGRGQADAVEEGLFGQPVLRHVKRARRRQHRRRFGQHLRRLRPGTFSNS